ncbi:MAG: Gfo/Idh/MocA family oxidoreductase [Coleofasciculaceae cyanobacterium RL_1_1]|nr:Gfo/Idh/MocA family oxidoreductase [Coleofasciculaceae cyanobacterium RL_1_1]
MSLINVAIVGTGFGQKVHIPGFQAHHRTQVAAVYHRDLATAQSIATAHEISMATDRLDAILDRDDIHAVSLATPPFLHYDMGKAILAAGKHLLLEKPTALTVAEARELAAIAQANDCITTMDFEYRFVPAWQYFAELIHAGYVGQPRLIRIDWLMSSRANPDRAWNWYAQKDLGGGALGALGSHTFDYISWLFGSVVKLSASLSTSIAQRPDPNDDNAMKPVDSDDVCAITLELANGAPCHVSISSTAHGGRGHWIEVYGDRGTLTIGSPSQTDYIYGFKVWGSKVGEERSELPVPDRLEFPTLYPDGRLSAFLRVVDVFVQGIDAGRAIAPSIQEGIDSQLLMDLTHESHSHGSWVNVPPL